MVSAHTLIKSQSTGVIIASIRTKVIIEKSRGEVFPMGQDTIEFIRNIFEVYGGFIGQKILKL